MDSTLAGLIGAAIGALAAIVSAFVASTLQARQEHHIWLRDRRQEAYANSVKYIVRGLNKRSGISIDGGEVQLFLGEDAQKEWFDDMSEALIWMTNLSIYCSSSQRAKITEALDKIRETMPFDLKTKAMSAPNFGPQILAKAEREGGVVKAGEGEEDLVALPFLEAFSSAYKVVLSSQRMEIGK